APAAAHFEVRRLALIRTARFDLVLGPDRNVEDFLLVPVEIADQQRERAVVVFVPAFKRGIDVRSRILQRFHGELLGRRCAGQTNEREQQECCSRKRASDHEETILITAAGDRSWSTSSPCEL